MKNSLNYKKLLNSKWTAVQPKNKEKHFLVTRVKLNADDKQVIDFIVLTASFTNRDYKMDYKELSNELNWRQGWL